MCRWHRPIGFFLLFLPCLWGYVVQARAFSGVKVQDILVLAAGAFWMRSFGCAYNDWIDSPYDRYVARTAARPLTAPDPPLAIDVLFLLFLIPGVFFLFLLPFSVLMWGVIGWGLSLIYPFLKRFVSAPQVFLAFLFNWGVWVGASFIQGPFCVRTLGILYSIGILWAIEYDTVYAYQDRIDDQKLGLKSLAVLWKDKGLLYLKNFFLIRVFLLFVLGLKSGIPYKILDVFYSLIFGKMMWNLNLDSAESCDIFFQYSWTQGLWILIMVWCL